MSTNSNSNDQSNSEKQVSSSQDSSQSDKTKESSSRIKAVDPKDTTVLRFDGGDLPKRS